MPDFRAKMHQKSISAVAPPIDPAEGAYSAPSDLLTIPKFSNGTSFNEIE